MSLVTNTLQEYIPQGLTENESDNRSLCNT